MRNYTTQMDAARKGIITPEMQAVAEKEYRTAEEIRDLVARGQVAICANRLHTCIDPNGVGSMLRTKINVNLGVSRDCKDYDIEMQKVQAAVDMGAEAIMDLSGWVVDMALYLERTGMEENMQANWMLKNAITRYHSSLEKLQMECRMLAAT
jgi:phosphomethylpyrimidine synthase